MKNSRIFSGQAPGDLLLSLITISKHNSFWFEDCFYDSAEFFAFYCYNKTIKLIFIDYGDGYLHTDTQLPV